MKEIHNYWEADANVAHCKLCGQWVWLPKAEEGKCKMCIGVNYATAA